ncbi:MAG: hypothetical protein ACI4XA_02175 [Oscillospiraceae bacterium]
MSAFNQVTRYPYSDEGKTAILRKASKYYDVKAQKNRQKGKRERGKGARGETRREKGANTMFALLPQKRDTMSRNRGQHGKSSIFVGFSFSPFPEGCPLVSRVKTQENKFCNKEEINTSIKKQLPPKKFYQPFQKGFKAAP